MAADEFNTSDVFPVPVLGREAIANVFETLFPGREISYLILGWVFTNNTFDAHNTFIAEQVANDPQSAALMLDHLSFSFGKVETDLDRFGFRGFKPHRLWTLEPVNCRITEMLPESLIELANERELIIVRNLGKQLGVASEENVCDLQYLAERYSKTRWDLPRLARSSIAWSWERVIDHMRARIFGITLLRSRISIARR